MRLGWLRPVHYKSALAQAVRAVLTARKLLQGTLHDAEMSIRTPGSDHGSPTRAGLPADDHP